MSSESEVTPADKELDMQCQIQAIWNVWSRQYKTSGPCSVEGCKDTVTFSFMHGQVYCAKHFSETKATKGATVTVYSHTRRNTNKFALEYLRLLREKNLINWNLEKQK